MHPHAAIQSPLYLHASTAHATRHLLAIDPVSHSIRAHGVILAYRAALTHAQHRIQIGMWIERSMGIARQSRLATKTPVPKWNVDLLQIPIGAFQIAGSHLPQAFYQPILCVPNERSIRPLACGEWAAIHSMFSSFSARPIWVRCCAGASR